MRQWLRSLRRSLQRTVDIPDALWESTLQAFPFLRQPGAQDTQRLRALCAEFLACKEFHGADGLQIDDPMALAIAAQACLPILHLHAPREGLQWYADFVGIVVHPDAVVARRESVDETGVVHAYEEELSGEAMQDGPVMLSWQDVARAGASAREGYNVVVHEFAHKLDMADGEPDGCPPLPAGFLGLEPAAARRHWNTVLRAAHEQFCDQLSLAERFGGEPPWLDPYASRSIDEFFAVACEAYFVNRPAFRRELAALLPLFDAFFRPASAPAG